ncbi:MAG: DUF4239 domain-containing protein [Vicinamibacterales bacterium]
MSVTTELLHLPQAAALLLLVGGPVAIGLLMFWAVHRRLPVSMRRVHNDVAGFVFASIGVLYGVLLGFAVLVVWEEFNAARANASHECVAAVALSRDLDAYPRPEATAPVRAALLEHVRLIVTVEYPMLARAVESAETTAAAEQIWKSLDTLQPQNAWEQSIYDHVLDRLNEMSEARATRLEDARNEVPSVLWIAIIGGGLLTVGFTCLFGTENVKAHAVMVVLLAALIGLVVYVTVELDHPFVGTVSIQPEGCDRLLRLDGLAPATPSMAALPPALLR